MNRKYVDENELNSYCVTEKLQDGFVGRLESLRRDMKLTQELFANKVGMNRNSYKQISNNPTLQMIERFVKAFPDVSLEWLALGVGDIYKQNNQVNNIEINNVKGGSTNIKGDNNQVGNDDTIKRLVDMQQQLIDLVTSGKK